MFTRVGDSEAELLEARNYLFKAGYKALENSLPEKVAYRRANDEGKALTETRFTSLNDQADRLAQEVVDALQRASEAEAA